LEKVIVDRDYYVLFSMFRDDPERLRKGLDKLEKMVVDNGAADCLNNLCAAHCDRRALLWLLHPFSRELVFKDALWSETPGPRSMKAFFGLNPKELGSLIKELKAVTSQLDIVNGQVEFSWLLKLNKQFYPVSRLPHTLRTCATVLKYAAEHFAGNSHIYHNIAKARLTSYVLAKVESSYARPRKSRRREYHDGDIACLISAISGDKDFRYDSAHHRGWRRKHYPRLEMLDPNVDQRLFPGLIPPRPT
jgi:hypothetical protein